MTAELSPEILQAAMTVWSRGRCATAGSLVGREVIRIRTRCTWAFVNKGSIFSSHQSLGSIAAPVEFLAQNTLLKGVHQLLGLQDSIKDTTGLQVPIRRGSIHQPLIAKEFEGV